MFKHKSILSLSALMLVLFIDGMGQGIIFPILTSTITNPHSTLFFSDGQMPLRHFNYGLLVGIYYFAWFISAPVLSDCSDRWGRKRPLIICLLYNSIAFLFCNYNFDS